MKKMKTILITFAVFCGLGLLGIALLAYQWMPFLTGKTSHDSILILENGYQLCGTNANRYFIAPPG